MWKSYVQVPLQLGGDGILKAGTELVLETLEV